MQAVVVSAVEAPRADGRKRPRRRRAPLNLDTRASERLSNRIYRVVCSDPWHWHCKSLILAGNVALKDDQAKELRRTGHYPPGGLATRMEQCSRCGHWT